MSGRLGGRIALVTGGGGDIGRASAHLFAREGARLVISDIDAPSGETTAAQIRAAGGDAIFVAADLTHEADVVQLFDAALRVHGRIDCAFNNAGIEGAIRPLHELNEDEFMRTVRVNLLSVWSCLKYEIRQMLRQGGGSIVNAASAAGLIGFPNFADYVATKHAVVGLTKTAALEYSVHGIRVNAVCPGMIDSAMVEREAQRIPGIREMGKSLSPIGRLGRPEDVAEAVVWLCSDAASFVTGHPMVIDGGVCAQ